MDGIEGCIDDALPFEIPENWEWCRIGSIATVLGGKRIPAGRKLTNQNTGHIYIRVSDMKDGGISTNNLLFVPDSKGGKLRRIYIPKALQNEALSWLNDKHQESGFIFLNKYGDRITTRGISGQLKKLAVRYGIDPAVVYPHSFRHRFAKSFLERCNDIAFLADLMGHESIETTRIYLRKTSTEQRAIVDDVIDW